jgi:hypothetical protein
VAPCSLPSSFGWSFSIVFAVCSTVYIGGGIAYNHKVKGERLAAENVRQLLPHVEHWKGLAGLVSDGMSFSKTSWDACVVSSLFIYRPVLFAIHAPPCVLHCAYSPVFAQLNQVSRSQRGCSTGGRKRRWLRELARCRQT